MCPITCIGHVFIQCSKLSQKSFQSSCLESQIINIKLKKILKKVPGPPPKLSASGRRTGSNLEHWFISRVSQIHFTYLRLHWGLEYCHLEATAYCLPAGKKHYVGSLLISTDRPTTSRLILGNNVSHWLGANLESALIIMNVRDILMPYGQASMVFADGMVPIHQQLPWSLNCDYPIISTIRSNILAIFYHFSLIWTI